MSAPQNTIEWKQERRGYITSSRIDDLMGEPRSKAAKEAGELSQSAKTYIMELIAEDMGIYKPDIETDATRWGHEYESLARWHYERERGVKITVSPFITSSDIIGYGGSPDGVSNNCVYEIKCPYNTAIHLKYVMDMQSGIIPKEHYWQAVSNAVLTLSEHIVFISFDPRIDHPIGAMSIKQPLNEPDAEIMIEKIKRGLIYKQEVKKQLGLI